MKLYCVIGHPISHSLSPKIHNAAFRKKRVRAKYVAVDVSPKALRGFMRTFANTFSGANVTIPHKETIMKFLDFISPEASAIGAVNTVRVRDGLLEGHNTDVIGALRAIKKEVPSLKNKHAVVIGAGGAARAVVYGLKKGGAKITIYNRTPSKAKKLAREFGCSYSSLKKLSLDKCDILINTTSVGMWPHIKESPVPRFSELLKESPKKPVVMDIVYRPHITKLLRDAKRLGCKIVPGEAMFLSQAEESRKLWR